MMRKFFKQSDLRFYSINKELEGHIFSLGKIGSGKSVSTKSIIEGFQERGYKIFDLYGGERDEGLYWSIPSQDKDYWAKISGLGQVDEEGPKQYNVTYLFPYFESHLPKRLPQKLPHVTSKLFTIPLKDVSFDDLKLVVDNLSDTSKFVWDEIVSNSKKEDDSGCLMHLANKIKGSNITPVFKNFISPMYKEKFLGSEYNDYNLDVKSEMRNRDTVTVLVLKYVPERFHLFILNHILEKLINEVDESKTMTMKRNIIFVREAATFFRATDDSVLENRFKVFRTKLAHFIRMGRRGTHFCLDTQSSSETKGLVEGSQDFLLMFQTTSWRDKEDMTEGLRRERRMLTYQINDLAFLNKGECYIAENGERVTHKVKITLPRSDYWKKEYPNFFTSYWESHGGEWKTTKEIEDMINNNFNKTKTKYKLLEDEEKMKKEEKKNQIKEVKIKTPDTEDFDLRPVNTIPRKLLPLPT